MEEMNKDMLPRMPPDREAARGVLYEVLHELAEDFSGYYRQQKWRAAREANHAASAVYCFGLHRGILTDEDGAYFFGNRPYKEKDEAETAGIFPERQIIRCGDEIRKIDAETARRQALNLIARGTFSGEN